MAEELEPQPASSSLSPPPPPPPKLDDHIKQSQVPGVSGIPTSNGDIQMFPIIYPVLIPGIVPPQNHEQSNRGAGIYAVPVLPFMGSTAGIPSNTLIPLTYNIPTTTHRAASGAVSEEHGPQEGRHQHAPQRQLVVRRFHFAFHLDLLLILKLAAVIFVFNQDGSRQRLFLLVLFAIVVYLYQTGALTPLIRWLSQGMHRPGAPPQPRPVVRDDNGPGAARPGDENAAAEGLPGGENANQVGENENQRLENQNEAVHGVNWWAIVKEVQMIVVGFITSLLPGFHNVD